MGKENLGLTEKGFRGQGAGMEEAQSSKLKAGFRGQGSSTAKFSTLVFFEKFNRLPAFFCGISDLRSLLTFYRDFLILLPGKSNQRQPAYHGRFRP